MSGTYPGFGVPPAARPPRRGGGVFAAIVDRILGAPGVSDDFRREFVPRLVKSWKVIEALILREAITRYGRRSAGFVWALLTPSLQLAGLMLLFSLLGRQAAAGEYLSVFFITGIIPVRFFRNAAVQGASAITGNRGMLSYPQIRPLHIVLARTLLELLILALVLIVFVVILRAFFGVPLTAWVDEPLKALSALGCLALFGWGAAVISSQIGRVFDYWGTIMSFVGRILFFTSGVFYTFASLPSGPRAVMVYNPIAHNIEWLRDGVIPGFDSSLYNPAYPLWCGLVLLAVGLAMEWLIAVSRHVDD